MESGRVRSNGKNDGFRSVDVDLSGEEKHVLFVNDQKFFNFIFSNTTQSLMGKYLLRDTPA